MNLLPPEVPQCRVGTAQNPVGGQRPSDLGSTNIVDDCWNRIVVHGACWLKKSQRIASSQAGM